jgi:MFS family permease
LFSTKKLAIATIGAALLYFCAMFVLYGINTWYPTLMLQKGFDISTAYGMSLGMNVAGICGNVAAGFLLEKLGRRNGEILGQIIAVCFILIMAWISGGTAILALSALLVGFAINYVPPSINSMTPELFPTNARASGVSFVASCGRVAGMIAPIAAGALLGMGLSYEWLISCFGLAPIVGLILVFVFTRGENSSKTLDEVES